MNTHLKLTTAAGGRDRDNIARRVCIHREVDNVVDAAIGPVGPMLRALAQDVGGSIGEDVLTERAMLLTLAGYAQARVEHLDRQAAR